MRGRQEQRTKRRARSVANASRATAITIVVVGALAMLAPSASAQAMGGAPLNDLFALGLGFGQTPAKVPLQTSADFPTVAVPRAQCGPGSHPEPGIQGRVPSGAATNALDCNVTLVSHTGTSGGFKVFRYTDLHGNTCAFYDTTLLFPLNALNPAGGSAGVAVLDMSDPARPVQTASLTELPMLSPHESLNLNVRRGLLAAVNGNPATEPGVVSIYDVSQDCRHPVLDSTAAVARLGHESGFTPDGNTFYATTTALPGITAIDVSNPKAPQPIWQGSVLSHGMSLSDDGNRAYVADPLGGDMLILDTSEIQARVPNPQAREISRVTWPTASIPQNAIPFSEHGHPYVLEFDEYTAATLGSGSRDQVGAARIIDIADESHPRVVSNIRLQVNQPAEHKAAGGDPGAQSPVQGYAAHYCNFPTRVDPQVVACSFIASGLRVFDIGNLAAPKEIAYFVAPTIPTFVNMFQASDFAMSQPAFAPDQREIWYSDGATGFYDVRVAASVWPRSAAGGSSGAGYPGSGTGASQASGRQSPRACTSRRHFRIRVRIPRGESLRGVRVTLAGTRLRLLPRGRAVYALVNLRGRPRGTERVRVRVRLHNGRIAKSHRTFHTCVSRRRS